MANHQSAVKRIRQTKRRNEYNRAKKKEMRMAIRAVREASSYEDGMEKLKTANKVLDKASAKHIVHKNFAAKRMSRLSKFVKGLKQA